MKLLAQGVVLLALVCSLFAQSKPPVLMSGLGEHHHTISTKNPEAQRFFDQGLGWFSLSTTRNRRVHFAGH